jgi:hypothetical protein
MRGPRALIICAARQAVKAEEFVCWRKRRLCQRLFSCLPLIDVTRPLHSKPSFAPRPAKMNLDNHPIRDEIDHEKVEYDKSPKCYRHDSDGLHSKENTPVVRRLTVETRR